MLTIRRCELVKPVILVATVTYFVVAVNNKQINSLYDSFIVNTTSGDTRAICKLASVKTRQIHHVRFPQPLFFPNCIYLFAKNIHHFLSNHLPESISTANFPTAALAIL